MSADAALREHRARTEQRFTTPVVGGNAVTDPDLAAMHISRPTAAFVRSFTDYNATLAAKQAERTAEYALVFTLIGSDVTP